MIQIRKAKKNDRDNCQRLLSKCALDFEQLTEEMHEFFVVDNGKEIVGICGFVRTLDHQAQINCLYIENSNRKMKLGDGLLRGTLNYLDQMHVKTVFIHSTTETHGFYMREDLSLVTSNYSDANQLIFKVDLPEFFEKPCKGNGLKI